MFEGIDPVQKADNIGGVKNARRLVRGSTSWQDGIDMGESPLFQRCGSTCWQDGIDMGEGPLFQRCCRPWLSDCRTPQKRRCHTEGCEPGDGVLQVLLFSTPGGSHDDTGRHVSKPGKVRVPRRSECLAGERTEAGGEPAVETVRKNEVGRKREQTLV